MGLAAPLREDDGAHRLRPEAVELRLLSLRLQRAHRTAEREDMDRPVVLVRVLAADGEGWGECAALAAPTYSEEYALGAFAALRDHLAPILLDRTGAGVAVPSPDGAGDELDVVRGHHMAKAALRTAVLDATLRAEGRSLADHLGVVVDRVPAGAVAGLPTSPGALVARVEEAVAAGYQRVKVKIAPGNDLAPLRAVRDRFPTLPLQADANGAYRLPVGTPGAPPALRALDDLGLLCLEQPLGHVKLGQALSTPLCLDESLTSVVRLEAALALGACRVACLKAALLGGIDQAVAALERCRRLGADAWIGGMLETGLGRAVNAALAGLEGISLVGDIGGGRRFEEDDPFGVVDLDDGSVPLYRGPGVGPAPDAAQLDAVTARVERIGAPRRRRGDQPASDP
jgi:O-succinylbenzoate synthase